MMDPNKQDFEQQDTLLAQTPELSEPAETAEAAEKAETAEAAESCPAGQLPPEAAKAFENRSPAQNAPQNAQRSAGPKPRYVGRITLGLALIFTGGIITAAMLAPGFDLIRLAKFTPLILVALGAEILISSFIRSDRPVKVGFGTTLLCLVLIGGSVCAALLPQVWQEYGPPRTQQINEAASRMEKTLYQGYPAQDLESLSVSSHWVEGNKVHLRVDARLSGSFENAQQFAEKALPLVQIAAGQDEVDTLYISTGDAYGNWSLSLDPVYPWQEVSAEALAGRVQHSWMVYTQDGAMALEDEKFQKMKEEGTLFTAEALDEESRASFEEGYADGIREAGAQADQLPGPRPEKTSQYQEMREKGLLATPDAVEAARLQAYSNGCDQALQDAADHQQQNGGKTPFDEGFDEGFAEGYEQARQEFENEAA